MIIRWCNNSLLKYTSRLIYGGASSASQATASRHFSTTKEEINLRWRLKDGSTLTTPAKIGDNLLTVAHKNHIDMEGACGGVCACSTCHVILPDDLFDTLPEASEEEEDMLDLAAGLTVSSRLGCQVEVTRAFEGRVIKLPSVTRNFYVDGHVPKPH